MVPALRLMLPSLTELSLVFDTCSASGSIFKRIVNAEEENPFGVEDL